MTAPTVIRARWAAPWLMLLAVLIFPETPDAAGIAPAVNSALGCTNSGDTYQYNGSTMVCASAASGNLTDSGTTLITAAAPTIPTTYTLALFDPTSNAIGAAIQACNGGTKWDQFFKDASGQAATHNITLTPSAGTIDGSATAIIGSAYGSLHIHSNGAICSIL